MKNLYVVRHAKSSWVDFTKSDFERTLNERGIRDAPDMAGRILKRHVYIDCFVSSPAVRAKETCNIFCGAFGKDPGNIIFIDRLYNASLNTFYEVVRSLDDRYSSVAIFSHNPGITDFVNSLCETVRVGNMPTSGVFGIESPVKEWKKFKEMDNQYLFFDYPKS